MKEMHSERRNNYPKVIQLICSETETWIQSDSRICPFPLLYYITPFQLCKLVVSKLHYEQQTMLKKKKNYGKINVKKNKPKEEFY